MLCQNCKIWIKKHWNYCPVCNEETKKGKERVKFLVLTRMLNTLTEERRLIQASKLPKIAVNHVLIRADYRLFHDYDKFGEYTYRARKGERLVTMSGGFLPPKVWMYYKPVGYPSLNNDKNEVIEEHKFGNQEQLYFSSGSIVPAVDLATRLGATEILIVGDNTVHGERFQEGIKEAMQKLKAYCDLFCFKAENNFDLPYKDLAKFLL